MEISQNFVAFSEYMNFTKEIGDVLTLKEFFRSCSPLRNFLHKRNHSSDRYNMDCRSCHILILWSCCTPSYKTFWEFLDFLYLSLSKDWLKPTDHFFSSLFFCNDWASSQSIKKQKRHVLNWYVFVWASWRLYVIAFWWWSNF